MGIYSLQNGKHCVVFIVTYDMFCLSAQHIRLQKPALSYYTVATAWDGQCVKILLNMLALQINKRQCDEK